MSFIQRIIVLTIILGTAKLGIGTSREDVELRSTTTALHQEIDPKTKPQPLLSVLNPRPTQFLSSNLKHSYQSGGLLLPANNQIIASEYQSGHQRIPSRANQIPTQLDTQPSSSMNEVSDSSQTHKLVENRVNNSDHRESDKFARSRATTGFEQNLSTLSQVNSNIRPPPSSLDAPVELGNLGWLLHQQGQLGAKIPDHRDQPPSESLIDDMLKHEKRDQLPLVLSHSDDRERFNHHQSDRNLHQNDDRISREQHTVTEITTTEVSNHVLSEPTNFQGSSNSSPLGEFYFSSSEKLPNVERDPNAWWAIGFGQQYEIASNLTQDDYLEYCERSEFLVSNKQKSLCRSHWKIMPIVARGLRMAIDECQTRFSSSRWNCSLILHNSINDESYSPKANIFGGLMKMPIRERSFLNAIFAAGLAHAMTKACSQDELPEECSCDKKIRTRNNRGNIEWTACSDDIDFGSRFSRDFTDDTDVDSDNSVAMINTHNYEAGRRVFKSATDITCTCQNGDNGLCTTKKCWKHLAPFADISDELMRRYEAATHVQPSNRDPHKLRPVKRGVRRPKRKDLVYIDESPDFCNPNSRLGIQGTQNRHCNSTSAGPDSCSLLCCGRGYQVVVEEFEEDCNCQFFYCCRVVCDKCKRNVTYDVCN